MNIPTILIAEGDDILRQDLKRLLLPHGFEIIEASGRASLKEYFQSSKPDLIIIGANQKRVDDGLKKAKQVRRFNSNVPVILITKYSSEKRAIAALRAGINDYLKWPLTDKDMLAGIRRNLSDRNMHPSEIYVDNPMIGNSEPMQKIKAFLAKVSATDSNVLITGETGTGKELAAQLIHQFSARKKGPFICINCAAVPESLIESEMFGHERGAFTGAVTSSRGKFEQAKGGTVFLDEITDMSLYAQAKILRVLERKEINRLGGNRVVPVDIRITAATNQDPEQLVEQGNFREDLYYRLNVARVHLPPLRDRKEDIPYIVKHMVNKLNHRYQMEVEGLTVEAMETLFRYHWPGNVRELINLLESTFINPISNRISFMDFPDNFRKKLRFSEEYYTNERDMVLAALAATKWNKTEAAKKLKWSRMRVYRTLQRHKINFQQNNNKLPRN